MPSWQSYALNFCLRLAVKSRLRQVTTPAAARQAFQRAAPSLPKGAQVQPGGLGGVPGEWVSSGGTASMVMLYLHGGGYFACSPTTHRAITGGFANRGFKVFAPRYRLAPEHPFPAALEDALCVYKNLLAEIRPEHLIIAGDSAGGGLAIATLLAALGAGLPMPSSAILFSPWTDLAGTGGSLQTNLRRDPMLDGNRIREAAAIYLNGADPRNPLISPLYGDFSGLPPLLIQVGEDEVLLDDSTRLAARARSAGVKVTLKIWKNTPHVWQLFQRILPEARAAMAEASAFAEANLTYGLARTPACA